MVMPTQYWRKGLLVFVLQMDHSAICVVAQHTEPDCFLDFCLLCFIGLSLSLLSVVCGCGLYREHEMGACGEVSLSLGNVVKPNLWSSCSEG